MNISTIVGLSGRRLVLRIGLALLIWSVSGVTASMQRAGANRPTTAANAASWKVPRTPDGQPDLQGVWSFATLTPLERPAEFATKEVLTEQEAAAFEAALKSQNDHDQPGGAWHYDAQGRRVKNDGDTQNYNEFWYDAGDKVVKTRRSSLVIDPSNGRIPYTAEGVEKRDARGKTRAPLTDSATGDGDFDSVQNLSIGVRCLNGFNAGPPLRPGSYNNNVQLFQSRDYAVIFTEMIHQARIVPLDGRPHIPLSIRQWTGDSRGHWEGNTLVVETVNFNGRVSFNGSTENLRLIERFTRTDAETLFYEYTIEDPAIFSKPWTAQIPMTKQGEAIYEYACHEGNHSLPAILAGAREKERAEAAKQRP